MSLKDLLPEGSYDEIVAEANAQPNADTNAATHAQPQHSADCTGPLMVTCPPCHKRIEYSSANPFRPFCSERCKLIDLGAWASEERTIAGRPVNEDEDADLLNDPNLPLRHTQGSADAP